MTNYQENKKRLFRLSAKDLLMTAAAIVIAFLLCGVLNLFGRSDTRLQQSKPCHISTGHESLQISIQSSWEHRQSP
jgi:hypothetical protein